jgi:hypothetical protein
MATLAAQNVNKAGLNPAFSAAAGGGDKFAPGNRTFLYIKNAHTASWTVTIDCPTLYKDQAVADVVVTVPNASERIIGPFPADLFAQADGLATLAYTGVTALTVAVLKLAN